MTGVEVIALAIVAVNVIWGLVYLISKGLSAETVTVMTAAVGALTAATTVWVRLRRSAEPARGDEDGGQ